MAGSWKINLHGTYTSSMFILMSLREKQEAALM